MEAKNIHQQSHHGITWIDLSRPTREQVTDTLKGIDLHPLHLTAAVADGHLPQFEKEDKYVFVLLQLPDYRPTTGKMETKQVAFFLTPDRLITTHNGSFKGLQRLFDACAADSDVRDDTFRKSAGYLLSSIIDNLLADVSDLIQVILKELDQIEDVVFDDHVAATYKIGQLRQRITKLKRLTEFLKTILGDLAPRIDDYTGEQLARYYRHNARTAERLSMLLEESKETVEIFKDADYTASNEKTNTTLAILTIIFTFTIPATVIASFYGMNVPLPGGNEAGPWTFWGPYSTLIILVIAAIAPALLMWWYFKQKRWF
jgi:magnesium transporter